MSASCQHPEAVAHESHRNKFHLFSHILNFKFTAIASRHGQLHATPLTATRQTNITSTVVSTPLFFFFLDLSVGVAGVDLGDMSSGAGAEALNALPPLPLSFFTPGASLVRLGTRTSGAKSPPPLPSWPVCDHGDVGNGVRTVAYSTAGIAKLK